VTPPAHWVASILTIVNREGDVLAEDDAINALLSLVNDIQVNARTDALLAIERAIVLALK